MLIDFRFRPLDEYNAQIAELIASCSSVSIHVRRGDTVPYKVNENEVVDGRKYYEKAVALITDKVENPTFFVFSDGIDWCKNVFTGNNFNFIDHNKSSDSYKDMQLMSLCKHNIIANSSFSWWGAWLNGNNQKIVIAPQVPLSEYSYDKIPDSWVKI